MKDPENPKHWILAPEAVAVVRHIFALCLEGRAALQIAKQLKTEKVLTPIAYKKMQGKATSHLNSESPYGWADKLGSQYFGTPGIHRLYGQFQDLYQQPVGQEAA
ncbi:MAG: recombinase family protein [Lachnospiraceae bacterium]|nr:recombinase family protein [Lachnospiraceae bacterium]